jgi:hypothetical protein
MSVFHQWLLVDPANTNSAHAIILHMADCRPCDLLIQEISEYLNEYDDEGDGRWLPATPELVDKVARDPSHRRLLGLTDPAHGPQAETPLLLPETLRALGRRGHVIFRSPGMSDSEIGLTNAFHAGVGTGNDIHDDCHLILNPDMMGQKCVAHIIGDVFLEWLHCEPNRGESIRDIR